MGAEVLTFMISRLRLASGPGNNGPPIPGLRPGANYDDQGQFWIYEYGLEGIVTCGPCLQLSRRTVALLTPRLIERHMESDHPNCSTRWRCTKCKTLYAKLHAAECHLPKCKGMVPQPQGGKRCGSCPRSFPTQRGLSQHERHCHPIVRNEKRENASTSRVVEGPRIPRHNSVWTQEETDELIVLEERFKAYRNINLKIASYLSRKTSKQVSDKRRDLRMRKTVTPMTETEEGDDDETSESSSNNDRDAETSIGDDEVFEPATPVEETTWESSDEWKQGISDYARGIICPTAAVAGHLEPLFAEIDDVLAGKLMPQELDRIVDAMVVSLLGSKPVDPGNGASARNQAKRPGKSQARFRYAKCQDVYRKCPRKLAEVVIKDTVSSMFTAQPNVAPNPEDVKTLYTDLWGSRQVGERYESVRQNAPIDLATLMPPITPEDVKSKLRRVKCSSAPGPDGLKKIHLLKVGVCELLAKVFNALVTSGHYPRAWLTNRTTLIPKDGKDLTDAANWRPITISSLMARLLSSLMESRLKRAIPLCSSQRGFVSVNGCFQNAFLLGEAIKRMKVGNGGTIVQVDLSKAFDTVPHYALQPEMLAKGIHPAVTGFIMKMYDGAHTVVKTGDKSIHIPLLRGVKQGDPLSPLLFNVVIDNIVQDLSSGEGSFRIEGENLGCLAFADDIIILNADKPSAVRSFNILKSRLDKLRMQLSVAKCGAFSIVPRGKSWYVTDPAISIQAEPVPFMGADTKFKYLGVQYTPWHGLHNNDIGENLGGALNRLLRLSLKPHQKLDLLTTHILPHYTYTLINDVPSLNDLMELDSIIRTFVKKCLHLASSTTDSLLYVGKRDGGLAIPRLKNLVGLATLRAFSMVPKSNDLVLQKAFASSSVQGRLKNYCRHLNIDYEIGDTESVKRAKAAVKARERATWHAQKSQGVGASYFANDPHGNCWLYEPTLLKPSRYIDALKLRSNTYGNRTTLRRAGLNVPAECRHCRNGVETLGHVLGSCSDNKQKVIRRHNECLSHLESSIFKSIPTAHVMKEPSFRTPTGLLKPDLVVFTGGRVFVADVTVRYEDRGSLDRAFEEKVSKYGNLVEQISSEYHLEPGGVLPIVVGSRGAIPNKTIHSLKCLKLGTKSTLKTFSLIALRSSIEMANKHIDT